MQNLIVNLAVRDIRESLTYYKLQRNFRFYANDGGTGG